MTPNSIRAIILDVDGVLTDGSIVIDANGIESKRFHVRDGLAIKAAMSQGIPVAIISSRSSEAVDVRMRELGIEHYIQGTRDKSEALDLVVSRTGIQPEHTAYMGDDLLDLPALKRCGYRMTVADAAAEIIALAHYTTTRPGGHGAVREAIEHILKAQDKWEAVLKDHGL